MHTRGWVTLSIRLVGLASVLWGVYGLIATIEAASTMRQLGSLGGLAKDTALAGMFNTEAFRPSYVGPVLWIGAGLALMLVSGAVTRLLFTGIQTSAARISER